MHKFAVFDIDGTLIRWQLYHTVVNRLAKSGALGLQAQIELKEAMMKWKKRDNSESFKEYEHRLVKHYEQSLRNIDTQFFDELVYDVFNEYKDQTYTYSRNLLNKLKKDGYKLFIISGSQIELIEKIAKYYGFDDYIASQYQRDESGFTGEIQISTLNKSASLKTLLKRNNVTTKDSFGIGDTKSDINFLQEVENPIAFNPDTILYNEALKKGWPIVVERKNVIYELKNQNGKYILNTT